VIRHERRRLCHPQTGAVAEVLISANPIRNQAGETIAALIIVRDVTELTQLQRRSGDMERHRAIGQMAAALAHDFNNILATVSQAAALLEIKMNEPPAERKVLLDMIQNTVRRGAEIIARVREYLRTGSGALSKVDMRQVMQEAVELTKPLWQKANVSLVSQLQAVPKARANQADLRRVFTNLIINAIEAMPRGGQITLSCELRGDQVIASITDTGVGIPPEQQKRIFFPYFTTKERGTGLGLSGAQKILLAQGGNISFHSQVGQGTTFTVSLPAVQEQSKEPAA
jgi:signal transduction histidine kinase